MYKIKCGSPRNFVDLKKLRLYLHKQIMDGLDSNQNQRIYIGSDSRFILKHVKQEQKQPDPIIITKGLIADQTIP